jgi:hypothetical protein
MQLPYNCTHDVQPPKNIKFNFLFGDIIPQSFFAFINAYVHMDVVSTFHSSCVTPMDVPSTLGKVCPRF